MERPNKGQDKTWAGAEFEVVSKGQKPERKQLRCKKENFSLLNTWKKFCCEKEQKNGVRLNSKFLKLEILL